MTWYVQTLANTLLQYLLFCPLQCDATGVMDPAIRVTFPSNVLQTGPETATW